MPTKAESEVDRCARQPGIFRHYRETAQRAVLQRRPIATHRRVEPVGATRIDLLRAYYRSVTLVRTSTEPYKWIVEGPAPIYLCRDPIAPLATIWPRLRWYGA